MSTFSKAARVLGELDARVMDLLEFSSKAIISLARRTDAERLREHDGEVLLRLANLFGRNTDRAADRAWLVLR